MLGCGPALPAVDPDLEVVVPEMLPVKPIVLPLLPLMPAPLLPVKPDPLLLLPVNPDPLLPVKPLPDEPDPVMPVWAMDGWTQNIRTTPVSPQEAIQRHGRFKWIMTVTRLSGCGLSLFFPSAGASGGVKAGRRSDPVLLSIVRVAWTAPRLQTIVLNPGPRARTRPVAAPPPRKGAFRHHAGWRLGGIALRYSEGRACRASTP